MSEGETERPQRACKGRLAMKDALDDEDELDEFLVDGDDNSEDSGHKKKLKRLRKGGNKPSSGDGSVSKTQRPARQARVVQYVEIQSDEDDCMVVAERDETEEGEGTASSAPAGEGSRKSSRARKVSPKVAEAQKAGGGKKGRAAGAFDWGKWSSSSVARESRDEAQEASGRSKERVGKGHGDKRRLVRRPMRRRASQDDDDDSQDEDDEEEISEDEEISSDERRRPRRRLQKRAGKGRPSEEPCDERSRRSQRSSASGLVTYNIDDMFKESVEAERQMAKLYHEEDRARARQRRRREKGLDEGEEEKENGPVSSDDDSSDEEEGEGMPLPRLLARKALTQAEWACVCDGMNTSEITRGSFWIQEDECDSESPELIEKFLVRWQNYSYLHVSWETEADLTRCVGAPAKAALKRWRVKEGQGLLEGYNNMYNPDEHFDPSFLEIDRILAIEDQPDEDKEGEGTSSTQRPKSHDADLQGEEGYACQVQAEVDEAVAMDVEGNTEQLPQAGPKRYLIKWCGLPYSESTWEKAVDLQDKDLTSHIQLYRQRQEVPPVYGHFPTSESKEASPEVGSKEQGEGEEAMQHDEGKASHDTPRAAAASTMTQPTFKGGGQLRDYQWEAVLWLVHNWKLKKGSILADEMGLGKTVQTMAYLNTLYTRHKVAGPFLIVAPLSTLQHWYREVCTWTDLNALVYHGSAEDRAIMWDYEFWFPTGRGRQCAKRTQPRKKQPKFQVLITTPEMCITQDNPMLTDIKWQVLVVDEAHRLKSRTSRLTVTLREQFHFDCTLLLTGTPLQNNTEELWTLLNFANPRVSDLRRMRLLKHLDVHTRAFSDVADFQRRYGDLKNQEQVSSLHKVLQPYLLRRMKEEVEKGLPPKEETIIEVEMTALQKQYYRALYEKNVGFLHKGGDKQRGADTSQVMNLHMELRKCCNHPFLLGRNVEDDIRRHSTSSKESGTAASEGDTLVECSGKLILLDKLLPKLHKSGHRLLIFSQFKIMLDVLEDYLTSRAFSFGRVDGSITGTKRQSAIDEFNKPGSPLFVMLLSTRAGGVGINLTTADTVIIFDSDWNPQNDVQAQARCHRIGQDRPVKIYRLLTSKTYEMKMFHSSSLKLGLDQAVLHGFEQQTGASASATTNTSATAAPRLTKDELEALLRHGAYDVFKEEREGQSEEHSRRFCEEDIDQILSRSTKIVHGGPTPHSGQATLGSFSKASFAIRNETISIDDPSFWEKVVGVNKRDTELQERSCRGYDYVIEGSKRYKTDRQPEGGRDSVAANSRDDSSDSDSDGGTNAALPYAAVNRIFTSLFHHGYGKWDLITQDAKLKEGWQPQVPLLCQHLVAQLTCAAAEQRARDLKAPPEAAVASATGATADGGEGAGTGKADPPPSKSRAPILPVPVDRADVLPQCRSLVEAYAIARVALQDLHKALLPKAEEEGGQPVSSLDWEDLGAVGEWLVDIVLPSAIPLEYMAKLLPRSGLEAKLRNLDDMLMLDKMLQGLDSGGDSINGGFLRVVLDPVRRAVKPPCDWWEPSASKCLIRNARSLLKGLRLGQKELRTLQESFPPQYSTQPWPNANKVSKYVRDLCEAFRRLDRGQSLSYQHQRPATSRPKVSSLSSSAGSGKGAGALGQQGVGGAGGGGAVVRGPSSSSSAFFSTGSSGRLTSMLHKMPAAGPSGSTGLKSAVEATAPRGGVHAEAIKGTATEQLTQPKQGESQVQAPPNASDSSGDDDVVLVLDDDDEEEEEKGHAAGPLRPTSPRKRESPARESDQEPPAKKAVRSDSGAGLPSGVQLESTTKSSITGTPQVRPGGEDANRKGLAKQVSITKWFSRPVGAPASSQQQ